MHNRLKPAQIRFNSKSQKRMTINMDSTVAVTMNWDRLGCDRMVVGFTTSYAINTYHH